MPTAAYLGKWKHWIHLVSNGRWIVGEKRGEYWYSKNAKNLEFFQDELKGHNPLDLVAKGCLTYASTASAIKALRRVYNLDHAS